MRDHISRHDVAATVQHLENISCISPLDVDQTFSRDVQCEQFQDLKALWHDVDTLLWVTSNQRDDEAVASRMIDGFSRALRSERSRSLAFIIIMSVIELSDGNMPDTIAKIFFKSIRERDSGD